MVINDDDYSQLPPALRLAAISSAKKKQAYTDRTKSPMTLRDEAKKMRLRLSKLEGSCSSVMTTSTTDADSKSGTHSTELLKKKLKKVEKMLDKSTVGTKEYKNLQKKRIEYQNRIGQQEEEQECCDVVSHSLRSLRLSQHEDSNSSVMTTPDVENASKLTTDTNKSSGTHSTEILKKKLKKVEKMLDKSTVGTKEYKNLQKKRTEYQNQIGQQGEEEEQEFEKDNTNIKEDAREEARRLMRNALEKKKAKTDAARPSKAKRSKEEKEKALLKKKQIQRHQELAMETKRKEEEEINKREEEERERQRPFKEAEADRKKKEAFLEEAQRLKKEAMENKRIHEKQEEEERQQRQYDRKKNEADLEEAQRLKKEAMENKCIHEKQEEEERQQRQCQIDDDDRKKNLADLEEAQRLKKEAMENKRIQEKQDEEERQQRQCQIDDDDRKKNEADLEEARRLNEEVMENKRIQEKQEEEERQRQCQVDDENRKKHEADLEEFRRQKKEEMEKNYIQNKIIEFAVVEENEIKRKQAILEEARALKKEAMEKKRIQDKLIKNGDDDSDRDSDTDSDSDSDDDSDSYSDKDEEEEEEEQRQCQDDDDDEYDDDEISKEKEIEGEEHKQEAIEETMAVDIHTIKQNNREMDQQSQLQERTESETKEEKDTTQPQEASKDFLDLRTLAEPYSDNTKKILKDLESNEIRQNKIERILVQNGIAITGCIAYEEAKDKIAEITDSMKDLMAAEMDSYTKEKKYFALEEQLAKYTTALMLTDEYAEDQIRQEKNWEDSIENDNIAAIQKLRSHMPVKIRHMTEDELATSTTPNGKTLPKVFARKFKRTNILQFLRVDPDDIEKMHPSTLESTRTTGLTLTERRAIHEHFKEIVDRWAEKRSDPSMEKKWQWYQSLRTKFREILNAYSNCVDKYGPPGNHQYVKRDDPGGGGCPLLGNQCPLKADATMDYSEDYGYTKEAEYENSSGDSGSRIKSPRGISRSQQNTPAKSKTSEAEMMEEFRCRLHLDTNETDVDTKLLRELSHSHKRIKTLEKQLAFAGLSLPEEDISYSAAKARVSGLTEELQTLAAAMGNTNEKELAEQESEFGRLSQELDKYNNALMLTKEWAQEQKDRERQWEINVSQANYVALQKIRRHMPVDIRNMSETALSSYSTPNGKVLPMAIVKKFKRTNILMILRKDPADIELMHPSSIEAMRTTGLTLTERCALHEHLKETAPKWKAMKSDKSCERKWMWHATLQSKLKEMMEKYDKHVETYGPPENHPYKKRNDPPDGTGCPLLGNQCPVKADLTINYNDDYGFPDHAEYEKQSVAKSNLLTMDDIDKRKREEDAYYSGSSGHS
jgi:hypothetical protein